VFLGCGAVSEAKRAGEREKEGRKKEGEGKPFEFPGF